MKITNLFLFAAAALVMGAGCSDDDPVTPSKPAEDAISLTPTEANVSSKGGKVSTMVTSSGAWTLSDQENAYVLPSVSKGVDGDIVEFTVKENDREEDQVFDYVFACGEKQARFKITLVKKASQAEEQLELVYTEESNILPCEGGQVKVLVTSSDKWTLEGQYDFVTPSVTEGEDGDEVVFDAKPNETYEDKTADYVFRMGGKEAAFSIVVKAETPESIEITSKSEMRLAYTAEKRLAVTLSTDVDPRDLTAEIVSETEGWLAYTIARPTEGGSDSDVTAYFTMDENEGETSREAVVTFKGVKSGKAELKIVQLPQPKIEPEKPDYYMSVEAQTLAVPVTANVEFDVTVGEEGNGWLTYNDFSENNLHFTVAELGDSPMRKCTVTLTEKNAPDNAEPFEARINISQKPKGLIETVADMRRSRCYFQGTPVNASAISGLSAGTMEALVNIQETRTAGSLSTIMGVEGKFLLRMGDATLPWNQLQLATSNGNLTDASLKLTDLDRWYHVAMTWDNGTVTFYVDGKKIYSGYRFATANFGVGYSGYESDYSRAFWIGYAYNADRWFPGYMSECRVWNRALTEEEINEGNHFYQVDPASDGLVGYWKLDGPAEGVDNDYTIKDYSPSGNNMVSEINVRSVSGNQIGDKGKLTYVEASLP